MREDTTATSFFLTDTQSLFPVVFSFHFSALETHPCAPRTDLPHISFIFKITLVLFIFILFNSIVPPPHSNSLRKALSNHENIGRNLTSYLSFSPLNFSGSPWIHFEKYNGELVWDIIFWRLSLAAWLLYVPSLSSTLSAHLQAVLSKFSLSMPPGFLSGLQRELSPQKGEGKKQTEIEAFSRLFLFLLHIYLNSSMEWVYKTHLRSWELSA